VFHYETENIASASASKTVEKLVFGIHMKRRGLLVVKWTQADMTIAGPPQMNNPAYHIDNVHRLLYKCGNS
jgi:hypothetical protein